MLFLATWWKAAVGIVIGALLIFPVASCQGRRDGGAQMQLAIEKANRHALQEKARADELAATQRLTDTIAVSQREGALRDAIDDTPDSAPDAVRIRLGCERLRASGQSTAAIPACRGPGG